MNPPMLVIQIDTREQRPLDFSSFDCGVETVCLPYGDYGIKWLSGCLPTDQILFSIERKEADLFSSLGTDRDRFEREIKRMGAYTYKGLFIEISQQDILAHNYRSKITPDSVMGTLQSWHVNYDLHVRFFATRQEMAKRIFELAGYIWDRQLKYARHFLPKRGEEARK